MKIQTDDQEICLTSIFFKNVNMGVVMFVTEFVPSKFFKFTFLTKSLSDMSKKSEQKFRYLKNKNSFKGEIKVFSIIF